MFVTGIYFIACDPCTRAVLEPFVLCLANCALRPVSCFWRRMACFLQLHSRLPCDQSHVNSDTTLTRSDDHEWCPDDFESIAQGVSTRLFHSVLRKKKRKKQCTPMALNQMADVSTSSTLHSAKLIKKCLMLGNVKRLTASRYEEIVPRRPV